MCGHVQRRSSFGAASADEDGGGWTTIAVDRVTRQWAVAQDFRQADTARGAYDALYEQ